MPSRRAARSSPRDVAVLVDTSTGWGRRLVHSVINFAHEHGNWRLWVEPAGRAEAARLPAGWDGHGIIARIASEQMADRLRSTRRPVVNVSGIKLQGADFPRVSTNYQATAELAASHFLERGFEHFAYVGPFNLSYVREHREAFTEAVAAQGHHCLYHDFRAGASRHLAWRSHIDALKRWLADLPRPIGIFTWGTTVGVYLLHACNEANIRVPDEIAVLGGDDDRLACEASSPPMSGVIVTSEQIGRTACQQLDRMMRGRRADPHTLIDPIDITTRQSTDVLALRDPELLKALVILRQNAYSPMTIDGLMRRIAMSRRSLERMFQQTFGRTPWEEVRRLRMSRARQLLAQSDMSIPQVAESCGFATGEHFATLFKREHDITPLKYRSKVRGR